jgi:hypothetical protein
MQKDENIKKAGECRLMYRCALLAGLMMMGAAMLIAVSVNNLVVGAITNDISKNFSSSIIIHWSLSGAMMLLTGIWVLFLSTPLKKLERRAWWQGIIIGLVFILFGGGFWWRYPSSIHLPGFILIGLTLLVPLIMFAGKFKN